MKFSHYVLWAGAIIAVLDAVQILPASLEGSYDASTGTGTGFEGFIEPIDNSLPFIHNAGVWIVGLGFLLKKMGR
jgi:hypothetical protein